MEFRPLLSALWRNRVGPILVALQIAVTLTVLVNAAYVIQQRLATVNAPTGIDTENVFWVSSEGFTADYSHASTVQADLYYLNSLPGVVAAATTHTIPQSQSMSGLPFSAEPFALQKKQAPGMIYLASEKITDTLGLKLVAGRGLSAAAVTPPSSDFSAAFASWAPEVLITKALAQELFPGGDALGKTLHAGLIDRAAKIVGIVEQFQGRPGSGRGSEVFTQVVLVPAIAPGPTALYMVRTEPGRRDAVMGQVDKEMEKLQGGRYISRMETLSDTAARTRARGRATAILLAVVTVFVVAVTALGIFGLAAFTVTARTKQIGTRRAIGARKYHIVRFFLVENWMITTAGVVIGCGLALAVSVKLSLMFQSPRLPVYYLVGGILVTWFVGLAAVWIPARRAAAISPAVATRPV